MAFDKNKKFNWVAGKIGQTRQINRASLEESTQRALTTHQDIKIPDGPIVIDKDLLQRIYDQIAFIAWDKAHSGCEGLQKELDSLYPYLSC